jgi:dTDP-4-dehydrorhamnose reductase
MKVLVLGSDGLLGSRLLAELKPNRNLEAVGTSRHNSSDYFFEFTLRNLINLVRTVKPDYIINCIAVTSSNSGWLKSIRVNSLLPITLALLSKFFSFQVIHFSTNAVFSGQGKINSESSLIFPKSKYAFTKAMGDISFFGSLIIRTSFVGDHSSSTDSMDLVSRLKREKNGSTYKIEEDYYWNGVTLDVIVVLIRNFMIEGRRLNGIFHLFSSEILLRHQLVEMILEKLNKSNVKVSCVGQVFLKNFALSTGRREDHLWLWNLAGYKKVPTLSSLILEMKINPFV